MATHATSSVPADAQRKPLGERELIAMMAMLMALQAFGIDAILPALDRVAAALNQEQ